MRSRGMHKTEMPSIFRYRGVYRGLSLPPFISIARRSIHGHRCIPITGATFQRGFESGVGRLLVTDGLCPAIS